MPVLCGFAGNQIMIECQQAEFAGFARVDIALSVWIDPLIPPMPFPSGDDVSKRKGQFPCEQKVIHNARK